MAQVSFLFSNYLLQETKSNKYTAVYVITENTIEMLHADECMRQKLKRIFYAMF